MPRLSAMLMCKAVQREHGKPFSLIDCFRDFNCETFPATTTFTVVAIVEEPTPGRQKGKVTIRDQAEQEVLTFDHEVNFHPEFGHLRHFLTVQHTFTDPGQFTVAYSLDGEELGRLSLGVNKNVDVPPA